jgi:hypothetical protein
VIALDYFEQGRIIEIHFRGRVDGLVFEKIEAVESTEHADQSSELASCLLVCFDLEEEKDGVD